VPPDPQWVRAAEPLARGPREGTAAMLEIKNLVGGYESSIVLRDISLTVPDGKVVALLGPNGAGKSTTLMMASGLLHPKEGQVIFDGEDVTKLSPYQRTRKGICHIFEGRGVFPSLSVKENLLMQMPKGANKAEAIAKAVDGFPILGDRLGQIAGTMSGGEQQMLAIVRAYITESKVVLVDEASLGLAPLVVDGIFDFLERIAGTGVSLLIVEQYINRALELAELVYVLNQGEIVSSGPASQFSEDMIFALYTGAAAPAGAGPNELSGV
jgi:branched-chain amino acid transport system ATP-binding protein